MSNTDKKISYLDFKNLGQTMMANAKYIIGISIIGLLIGFLLSLSDKDILQSFISVLFLMN